MVCNRAQIIGSGKIKWFHGLRDKPVGSISCKFQVFILNIFRVIMADSKDLKLEVAVNGDMNGSEVSEKMTSSPADDASALSPPLDTSITANTKFADFQEMMEWKRRVKSEYYRLKRIKRLKRADQVRVKNHFRAQSSLWLAYHLKYLACKWFNWVTCSLCIPLQSAFAYNRQCINTQTELHDQWMGSHPPQRIRPAETLPQVPVTKKVSPPFTTFLSISPCVVLCFILFVFPFSALWSALARKMPHRVCPCALWMPSKASQLCMRGLLSSITSW